MNVKTLALSLLAASAACFFGSTPTQAATELWPVTTGNNQPVPFASVSVETIPFPITNNAGGFAVKDIFYYTGDSNGLVTMSNLLIGSFVATATGPFSDVTPVAFSITNFNSTNYVTANNSVATNLPGGANAFSMMASDGRYPQFGYYQPGANTTFTTNGTNVFIASSGGGGSGSQTPVTNTIDFAQHGASNLMFISLNDGVTHDSNLVLHADGSASFADGAAAIDANGNISGQFIAGNGANLSALNAASIATGTVATARLGSGTANSGTVLYGDQTYKAVSAGTPMDSTQFTLSNGTNSFGAGAPQTNFNGVGAAVNTGAFTNTGGFGVGGSTTLGGGLLVKAPAVFNAFATFNAGLNVATGVLAVNGLDNLQGDGSGLTGLNPANLSSAVPIAQGGTGSTNSGQAAKNLGAYKGYFSPTNLPNLTLWLSAASITGLADGAKVASWTDLSGAGNTATQATSGNQPTYSITNINYHPSVHFISGNATTLATPSFLSAAYNSNFTVFIVSVSSSSQNSARYTLGNGAGAFAIGQAPGSFYFNLNHSTVTSGTPTPYNRPHLQTYRVSSTQADIRLNGMEIAPAVAFTSAIGMSGALTIGNTDDNQGGWNGDIGEVVIYNAALSDLDCALVEKYLMEKYSVAKANIIFDGDSQTAGLGSSSYSNYPSLTMLALGPAWDAENFGHSGWTTTQVITNSAKFVDPRYNSGKDTISFLIGANDIITGATAAAIETNISAYCAARQAAGYRVVCSTILPSGNTIGMTAFDAVRLPVNIWLRANWPSFANALSDIGGDSFMGVTNNLGNTAFWNTDLLHPTINGYALMAPYYVNAILAAQGGGLTNLLAPSLNLVNATNLNASQLLSGTVPTARLGSGTANSGTVLYGDQTYKTAPAGTVTSITGDGTFTTGTITGSGSLAAVAAPVCSAANMTSLPAFPIVYDTSTGVGSQTFSSGNNYTDLNGYGSTQLGTGWNGKGILVEVDNQWIASGPILANTNVVITWRTNGVDTPSLWYMAGNGTSAIGSNNTALSVNLTGVTNIFVHITVAGGNTPNCAFRATFWVRPQ